MYHPYELLYTCWLGEVDTALRATIPDHELRATLGSIFDRYWEGMDFPPSCVSETREGFVDYCMDDNNAAVLLREYLDCIGEG